MSHYAHSKSAERKVREALIYQMQQITTDHDYLCNIGESNVYEGFPPDFEEIDYPSISVLSGHETRNHYDNQTLYITMKVPLLVFVDPEGNIPEEIEAVKQDIQYALGNNPALVGEDDEATCQLALYTLSEPFGTEVDNPQAAGQVGAKIMIDIVYQQTFADPTVN